MRWRRLTVNMLYPPQPLFRESSLYLPSTGIVSTAKMPSNTPATEILVTTASHPFWDLGSGVMMPVIGSGSENEPVACTTWTAVWLVPCEPVEPVVMCSLWKA